MRPGKERVEYCVPLAGLEVGEEIYLQEIPKGFRFGTQGRQPCRMKCDGPAAICSTRSYLIMKTEAGNIFLLPGYHVQYT
jgi:hypothetical protein